MLILDRLFSEATGNRVFQVGLNEEEYVLFSEFQKEFTKSNLNAKGLSAWQKAHPDVQLNLNDTKEANRIVKEYEKQHGAANTKQAYQNARNTKASVNESVRVADTTARNLTEGNKKQALEIAKHSSNPEQAFRAQNDIRQQVMGNINKETKVATQAEAFQTGMERRAEKTAAQNVGVGVRKPKPVTSLTPEQLEARKRYEERRQQRQVERRLRGPKERQSVKKTVMKTGQAQQQVANNIYQNNLKQGMTQQEAVSSLNLPKNKETIQGTTSRSFDPHEFKNKPAPTPTTVSVATPTEVITKAAEDKIVNNGSNVIKKGSWFGRNKKALAIGAGVAGLAGAGYYGYKKVSNKA